MGRRRENWKSKVILTKDTKELQPFLFSLVIFRWINGFKQVYSMGLTEKELKEINKQAKMLEIKQNGRTRSTKTKEN